MLPRQFAQRKSGLILALLGTAWLGAWPFLGINGGPGALLCVMLGVGLLWEGFGRLAMSRGLPKLHGAWAISALFAHVALYMVWVRVTQFQGPLVQAHYTEIVLSYLIVPPGLSWLLFWLGTAQAKKIRG